MLIQASRTQSEIPFPVDVEEIHIVHQEPL